MFRLELLGQSLLQYFETLLFPPGPYRAFVEQVRENQTLESFDLFILIPYFTILGILAIYGLHRSHLVFLYYKNKGKKPRPQKVLSSLPPITVQLPIYNEMFVVERLIKSVVRMDYPRHLLEIQVLDDSTDETKFLARRCVDRLQKTGVNINYFHRQQRSGYKAGALAAGLRVAKGEFIAIFDADFMPNPSFLNETIHYFSNPKVGMVQTRWGHINQDYNLLTQVEAIILDGHFVMEHGGRHRSGRFFNFNGTAGVWRLEAIQSAGGWQHDTLTEDTDLSYRAQLLGWQFIYLPDVVCSAELPVEMNAFKNQQFRWAKGLVQTGLKLLPQIVKSNLPLKIKTEAAFHLSANCSYPLMVMFSLIFLPAMIVRAVPARFYLDWFQFILIDFPLLMAATMSVSSFYALSQRELYPDQWTKKLKYLPFLMSAGIGLSISNSLAVLEALLGIKTSFKRTPKNCIQSSETSLLAKPKYRGKIGCTPFLELILGTYFSFAIFYAWSSEHYFTMPFLMLFLVGFFYTGLMSLFQVPLARLLEQNSSAPIVDDTSSLK